MLALRPAPEERSMQLHTLDRRRFLALAVAGLARAARSQEQITRPEISEDACPLEPIAPVARDGHRGQGILRRPPGAGPFPAILWIHGGLVTVPAEQLRATALNMITPSRFLAAGYVVPIITYRSRDHDPQSTVSLEDCLAAVDHVRRLPFVDPKSIVVYGCSGGGDLALEVAAATEVCAIVPEEPATVLLTGIFNTKFPKKGERFTPADAAPILEDPKRYYTAEYQKITQAKIARIRCPILIVQGDQPAPHQPVQRRGADPGAARRRQDAGGDHLPRRAALLRFSRQAGGRGQGRAEDVSGRRRLLPAAPGDQAEGD